MIINESLTASCLQGNNAQLCPVVVFVSFDKNVFRDSGEQRRIYRYNFYYFVFPHDMGQLIYAVVHQDTSKQTVKRTHNCVLSFRFQNG